MILHATNNDLIIKESERLISGSVKIYTCEFTFDESWDDYVKTVVFSTGGSRLVNVALLDNVCEIPPEVLRPNARVRIGIYGTDGVRSRPTTYSEWINVEQGADVTGNYAEPPTPSVYDQWVTGLDAKHEEWNAQENARAEAEAERVEAEKARQDLETGYVAQAKEYAEAAKASEEASASSQTAAESAVASVESAATSAMQSEAIAQTSAANALTYAGNAAYSAAQAAASEANAKASEEAASTVAVNAEIAVTAATSAAESEAAAKEAQTAAEQARDEAQAIAGGDFATRVDAQQMADKAESDANAYTDQKIAAIPAPDVSGQINSHNTSEEAHSDIRTAVATAQSAADAAATAAATAQSTASNAADAAATAQNTADGKAPATHSHAAGDITSGTLAADRIPSLATSKITSGSFSVARGGTGRSTLTSGSYLVGNGTSAVTMKTKAQVIADLGITSGVEMVMLWENASPNSAFGAQTLNLSLGEYDLIRIVSHHDSDGATIIIDCDLSVVVGESFELNGHFGGKANYREGTTSNTQVTFKACFESGSSTADNTRIIPMRIYGIKGVA